jgi:hypothetical protein
MPTTAVRDLLVEPLLGVGRADPAPVQLGEREVREQVGLGVGEQPGNGRHARLERGDDTGALVAGRCHVGLLEFGPDGRGDLGLRRMRLEPTQSAIAAGLAEAFASVSAGYGRGGRSSDDDFDHGTRHS